MTKDKQNKEGKEFRTHNHCWREDGTCYGAYGSNPDGTCPEVHEGIKKMGIEKYYSQEGKEKEIHKAPCPKAYFNETWNLDCDKQRCHPPESDGKKVAETIAVVKENGNWVEKPAPESRGDWGKESVEDIEEKELMGCEDCPHKVMSDHPESRGDWEERFVEVGANIEHDRWARWQKYMFSKCQRLNGGVLTIPEELVKRWFRQIETPYSDLSEEEKESDRKETRNYLPLIRELLTLAHTEGIKEGRKKEREVCRILICPCGCDMFIDEKGYEEAHSALQTKDK